MKFVWLASATPARPSEFYNSTLTVRSVAGPMTNVALTNDDANKRCGPPTHGAGGKLFRGAHLLPSSASDQHASPSARATIAAP